MNLGRSYVTFGTKILVFRANSECLLGTKWKKLWVYKNVSRIVKIIHSVDGINPSLFFDVPSLIEFPGLLPPFIHEERKHEGLYGQTASLEDQDCRMWG